MKLGCRAHDYGAHSAARLAAILHDRGYNACQLAMPKALAGVKDYRSVTPQQAAAIGADFAAAGVEISVLGCYMDLSSPDGEVRRQAVANVSHCLFVQKTMGAKLVGSESSYDHLDAEEKAARLPLLTDSVLRIVEAAARYDGVFAIEPVFWHPLDSVERVQALLDAAGDETHFKLIYDPANVLRRRDQGRQAALWQEWLTAFGGRIEAMHIKDFVLDGGSYCPRPLGSGVMDYTPIRAWLRAERPDMPLLREEVQLGCDAADLAFLRGLVQDA